MARCQVCAEQLHEDALAASARKHRPRSPVAARESADRVHAGGEHEPVAHPMPAGSVLLRSAHLEHVCSWISRLGERMLDDPVGESAPADVVAIREGISYAPASKLKCSVPEIVSNRMADPADAGPVPGEPAEFVECPGAPVARQDRQDEIAVERVDVGGGHGRCGGTPRRRRGRSGGLGLSRGLAGCWCGCRREA